MHKRYHVNPETGNPKRCSATVQNCPYEEVSGHFATPQEARADYETKQKEKLFQAIERERAPKPLIDPETGYEYLDSNELYEMRDHSLSYDMAGATKEFQSTIQGRRFKLETNRTEEPGVMLEKLFGKLADSVSEADLGEVELKTIKTSSAKTNTISLSAIAPVNGKILKEKFIPRQVTNVGVTTQNWSKIGDYYYRLRVNHRSQTVSVLVANSQAELVSKNETGWDFSTLHKKVDNKLAHIGVGTYEVEEHEGGIRTVTYDDFYEGGYSHESFIKAIETGKITVEFRVRRGGGLATVFKSKLQDFATKAKANSSTLFEDSLA